MLLQNKAKRLIIINGQQSIRKDEDGTPITTILTGKSWRLLPDGEPVDVSDEVCKCEYVQRLIKCGDVVTSGQLIIDSTAEEIDEEKDALREECELLEIKVDKRWSVKKLKEKIAEVEAAL